MAMFKVIAAFHARVCVFLKNPIFNQNGAFSHLAWRERSTDTFFEGGDLKYIQTNFGITIIKLQNIKMRKSYKDERRRAHCDGKSSHPLVRVS